MSNPFEMDLDVDEETGEVELPPNYRTRRPFGATVSPPQVNAPQPAPPPTPTQGQLYTTQTAEAPRCPPCPSCPDCPACPPAPVYARQGRESMLGIVIGLGLLGGVVWYAGTQLAGGMADMDEEDLDALPAPVIAKLAEVTS